MMRYISAEHADQLALLSTHQVRNLLEGFVEDHTGVLQVSIGLVPYVPSVQKQRHEVYMSREQINQMGSIDAMKAYFRTGGVIL